MTAAEKCVAGAYLVVFLTVLTYVLIIALPERSNQAAVRYRQTDPSDHGA